MKVVSYFSCVLIFQFFFSLRTTAQNCSDIKVLGLKKMYPVKQLSIIDERDVMWHRRLWREIDVTEKINQYLYFGNEKEKRNCSFYDMLYNDLRKGYIKAYDPKDDQFTKELTVNELINLVGDSVYDENEKLIYKKLDSRSVVKFWLKEDWFFDGKYSKIDVRIIGICPVKITLDKNGNVLGYKQLFWLYFPNVRGVLTSMEAFKKEIDKSRISFDDVFINRMFDSYIIQKEGEQTQHVRSHKTELDIKLENEKTKQYSYKSEVGLWGN